jgi:hypothetical protein
MGGVAQIQRQDRFVRNDQPATQIVGLRFLK